MKRNGFTLLELLIGISLISIVMIFLFRLLNDIQHEALSNTYIVANQTNRNEMINILDTALYENGDVCSLFIGASATDRLYKIGFCDNNKEIDITISKRKVKIEFDSHKYSYEMRDSQGYYEIALPYTITTFNGKKYIRFTIRTHKKGLRETIIDDIEMMGTVRTLTVKKENVDEFSYTGDEQEFVVPKTGRYKIELWGAQGGNAGDYKGGTGAYTSGIIDLTKDEIMYLYVGSQGGSDCVSTNCSGGYNGGGNAIKYSNDSNNHVAGGGGATDIRLLNGDWNNSESLASRIMVAAGGGGAYYHTSGASYSSNGGIAGGLVGISQCNNNDNLVCAGSANQLTGGAAGSSGADGSFGMGGSSTTYSSGGGPDNSGRCGDGCNPYL